MPPRACILLVHGTGATAPEDEGSAWWQRGSRFATDLERELDGHATCLDSGPLFRWSGANIESDRRRAARELLNRWLLRFEREERPYHLIAHSHGGSLIWEALVEAARRGHKLEHLTSWSTVGTPFIHYTVNRADWLLLIPLVAAVFLWASVPGQAFVTWQHAAEMFRDGAVRQVAALILVFLLAFGIGLYLAWRVGVLLASLWRLPRRHAAERKAASAYGSKWLGVWSDDDEAINGLKNTVRFEANLAPRAATRLRFSSVADVLRLALIPGGSVYNFFVARPTDAFISRRIARRLQGNDRTADVVHRVTSSPVDDHPGRPLPEDARQKLSDRADAHAAVTLRKIRQVLGVAAVDQSETSPQVIGRLAENLTYEELVHTSYFELPEIRSLLATHILNAGAAIESSPAPVADVAPAPSARAFPRRNELVASFSFSIALLVPVFLVAASIGGLFGSVYDYTDEANVAALIQSAPLRDIVGDVAIEEEKQTAVRDWMRALVSFGRIESAQEAARAISDEDLRRWARVWILADLAHQGRIDDAKKAVPADVSGLPFEDVAKELIDGDQLKAALFLAELAPPEGGARIFGGVALAYAHQPDAKNALSVMARIEEKFDVSGDYDTMTNIFNMLKQPESALLAAGKIRRATIRAEALARTAAAFQATKQQESAIRSANDAVAVALEDESNPENFNPGSLMLSVAATLAEAGLIEQAFSATERIRSPRPDREEFAVGRQQAAYVAIAKAAAARGLFDQARVAASRVHGYERNSTESDIAMRAVEQKQFDVALDVAQTLLPNWGKDVFRKIADVFAEEGKSDDAIHVLAKVADSSDQSWWLALMADDAIKKGRRDVASAFIDRALVVARAGREDTTFAALAAGARILRVLERHEDAALAARDATSDAKRHASSSSPNGTMLEFALRGLIEGEFVDHAKEVALATSPGSLRNDALRRVASALKDGGREEDAKAVLAEVVPTRFEIEVPAFESLPPPVMVSDAENARASAKTPRLALDALRRLPSSYNRDRELETTAHALFTEGDTDGAMQSLGLIDDSETYDRTAVDVIARWLETGRVTEAQRAADGIRDSSTRLEARLKIFDARPADADDSLLQRVRSEIEGMTQFIERSAALGELAKIHARRGELRQARLLARGCYATVRLSVHAVVLNAYAQRSNRTN